jgi:hypothetical protein
MLYLVIYIYIYIYIYIHTSCLFHLHRRVDMKCVTHFISTRLWRWNIHSVPKRRLLNTTRRGTTQKITRNIQNTAKAWNQKFVRICPSDIVSICLSDIVSICPSDIVSICLSDIVSICPSEIVSICLSDIVSICLSDIVSICPSDIVSICPHRKIRRPIDGSSWNFIFEDLARTYLEYSRAPVYTDSVSAVSVICGRPDKKF